MKFVFSIILISLSTNSVAIELLGTVPVEFQGNWSPRLEECGLHPLTQDVYPGLMTITEHGITYYESGGIVASIVRRNKNEIAMILEFSGGGDFWLAYKHFILSEDKKTLSDESNRRRKYLIYRCPDEGIDP